MSTATLINILPVFLQEQKKKKKKVFHQHSGLVLHQRQILSVKGEGGDVAQLARASDRHAADVRLIPWCSKEFFSQSQLSVKTLLHVSVHPICNRMH